MRIDQTLNGNQLTIALTGRLDTVTAPDFEQALTKSLDGVTALILDFSDLEYISSAGLRTVLIAHKRMAGQGTMTILGTNELVMEVFEATGLADILDFA